MADLALITAGIKTRLATISGLHVSSEVPDQINYPAAWPRLTHVVYNEDFGGDITLVFEVNLAVAGAQVGLARGQALLWPYLNPTGASSIKAAIEAGPTLGGSADSVAVGSVADISTYELNGVPYVGAKLQLEVYA